MTEDGPTWKAQAEALAAAVIENQSLGFLTTDEARKTDAVAGVSISVSDFISWRKPVCVRLREKSRRRKKPGKLWQPHQSGAEIDAISGANSIFIQSCSQRSKYSL